MVNLASGLSRHHWQSLCECVCSQIAQLKTNNCADCKFCLKQTLTAETCANSSNIFRHKQRKHKMCNLKRSTLETFSSSAKTSVLYTALAQKLSYTSKYAIIHSTHKCRYTVMSTIQPHTVYIWKITNWLDVISPDYKSKHGPGIFAHACMFLHDCEHRR